MYVYKYIGSSHYSNFIDVGEQVSISKVIFDYILSN